MQNGQILEVKAGEGYLVEITPGLLSDAPKLAGRLSALLGLTDPAVRAVIVTDSDHVILSATQPETISNRLADDVETLDGVDAEDAEP